MADVATRTATEGEGAKSDYFGREVERREDLRFLTGRARFCEDIVLHGMLHASVVRSPLPHARILSINRDAALAAPGVVAVYTAADFSDEVVKPIPTDWVLPVMPGIPDRYPLARNVVRFVGEGVVMVVAETRAQAEDAACLVAIEYDELPSVTDSEEAVKDHAPLLHENFPQNTGYIWHLGVGDFDEVARNSDHVFSVRLTNNRVHASSLEARVSLADYDPGADSLTLYLGTQNVHVVRRNLSIALGIPENRIRVVSPSVGGGFGSKLCLYPEDVAASAASRKLGRPVRWVETRSEHFVGTSGGRDHVEYVTLAANKDGRLQAIRVNTYANMGAYVSGMGAGIPAVSGMMFPGCYDLSVADVNIYGVFSNTSTTETYRGAGRPEAAYLIERAIDELAVELGIDRIELRRRNFIQPDQFPYENACGMGYDSGDYERAMDKALELVEWDKLSAQQAEARKSGRIVGLGIGTYVEFCGFGDGNTLQLIGFDRAAWEQSVVAVGRTGKVVVQVGIDSTGQGHETSIAQLVATELGLPIDDVEVIQGDTDLVHYGTGTFNSRSMSSAGSAAVLAARKVLAKARQIAAHILEVDVDDLTYQDGVFGVAGVPEGAGGRELTFEDVSLHAWRGVDMPEGVDATLKELAVFDPPKFTAPFGAHIASVEIDPDTGEITIDRYVAVDDCGNIISPQLVEGQVHGGVAQGIGQAMMEHLVWDEDGQPATTSFMQYAIPRAHHMPRMETAHTVTPSPVNPLGVKGIGESGVIGPPPAIVNAVMDALRPLGVKHIDMPLTPATVWNALQETKK